MAAEKKLRRALKDDVYRLQCECTNAINAMRASSAAGYTAGAEAVAEAGAADAGSDGESVAAARCTHNTTAMERAPGAMGDPMAVLEFRECYHVHCFKNGVRSTMNCTCAFEDDTKYSGTCWNKFPVLVLQVQKKM